MTENDFTDATSIVPQRRFGRRKIHFGSVTTSSSSTSLADKDAAAKEPGGVKEELYETFKEQICVVCARELDIERIDEFKNIYEDTSNSGTGLYDVFRALVKQEIQSTYYGSKVLSIY